MKSVKLSEESWKAVKVFAASNNWSIQGFIESAIREKLQREITSLDTTGKGKSE